MGAGVVRALEDEGGKENMTFCNVDMTCWLSGAHGPTREQRRLIAAWALSAGCLAAAGCGGDGGATPPDPPRAASLTVSPESASLSSLGETANFTATVRDQHGAVFSGSVTWASTARQPADVETSCLIK